MQWITKASTPDVGRGGGQRDNVDLWGLATDDDDGINVLEPIVMYHDYDNDAYDDMMTMTTRKRERELENFILQEREREREKDRQTDRETHH